MTREQFYEERDRRTVEYGVTTDVFARPVGIVVDPTAADSVAGQVATLALVNMAARIHRGLRLVVPDAPLTVPSLVEASSLPEAVSRLVTEIDPFNDFGITHLRPSEMPEVTIGVGPVVGVSHSLSADGYVATMSKECSEFGHAPSTTVGACLAACLGASALTRLLLGEQVAPRRVSMWNFAEGDAAKSGSFDAVGPIDIGSVVSVGAGAVASALAYWLRYVGVIGDYIFVDGDVVKLHNTNRSLGLLAHHAGWVGGEPGHQRAYKATAAASLIGAQSYPDWYDAWVEATEFRHPDLVLPLANGPGVRAAVGQRGEPILVHGTTSRAWTAELHRHLAEGDGCIACRLPEAMNATMACGTSPVPGQQHGNDAALPFLSGAAGLLVMIGLVHLANRRLEAFDRNHWQLHLDLNDRHTVSSHHWSCLATCSLSRNLPRELRRVLPRGTRWAYLD